MTEATAKVPRVRTIRKDSLSGEYRYKRHDIAIDYDQKYDGWYIIVTAPSGSRSYDGWWKNSAGKTHREAVLEALNGACLFDFSAAIAKATGEQK